MGGCGQWLGDHVRRLVAALPNLGAMAAGHFCIVKQDDPYEARSEDPAERRAGEVELLVEIRNKPSHQGYPIEAQIQMGGSSGRPQTTDRTWRHPGSGHGYTPSSEGGSERREGALTELGHDSSGAIARSGELRTQSSSWSEAARPNGARF